MMDFITCTRPQRVVCVSRGDKAGIVLPLLCKLGSRCSGARPGMLLATSGAGDASVHHSAIVLDFPFWCLFLHSGK